MDISAIHGLWTLVLIVLFVCIVVWAFSRKRKRDFDAAARIPFDHDETTAAHREGRRNG